jgi:phenylacetate-CoA ligase
MTRNAIKLEQYLRTTSELQLHTAGLKNAFRLFQKAAKQVPAYKHFLSKHNIHPDTISAKDFTHIPPTDKKNYISAYSLADRSWDGKLPFCGLIATSSGTSGTANNWPRGLLQEKEAIIIHEFIYRYLFSMQSTKRMLVVIGFPMGVYVSGIATLLPTWALAERYNIVIVSAGTRKDDILLAIKTHKSSFDSIIIAGHPFFIKDLAETGSKAGVFSAISELNIMLCSEGFHESWRNYLHSTLQKATKGTVRIISTYGSSEFLLMAHETNDSIEVKRALEYSGREESVFQYIPELRFFENDKKDLLCTANSGTPLIRHNIHDAGSILSQEEVLRLLKKRPKWHAPFLTLAGRSDYTLVFYAANIYPEHIRQALDVPQFHTYVTGKFSMQKVHTKSHNERLEIAVELRSHIQSSALLKKKVKESITKHLRAVNKEYVFISENVSQDVSPHILLRPYQDPTYFPAGVKPHYITL